MNDRPLCALAFSIWLPGCLDAEPRPDHAPLELGAAQASNALELPHPTSGWMEIERSPLVPWCGAVLVAPDVAVTADTCLEGVYADEIAVGFGNPERDLATPVTEIRALPGERLVALVLSEAIEDIEPASLTAARPTCDTTGISYEHAVRGEDVERWTWSGCVELGSEFATLAVERGRPNCHGESGAGVFSAEGGLMGIVIGGRGPGCIDTVELATLATHAEALERALDLSSPPA